VTFLNTVKPRKPLSELEHLVMECLWARGTPATAEGVREDLLPRRKLKDSSIRTILRRLEEKGYASHAVDGRTYVYSGVEAPQKVAVRAVRQIIERFCGGSVEQLVLGMVDNRVLDGPELQRLARLVARRKKD
jgi:predicted transcriptional regulator